MRIALTGPMYVGKSKLAEELAERGFAVADYSFHLKVLAARALNAAGIAVTPQDIAREKGKYRAFLQELGVHASYDQGGHVVETLLELPLPDDFTADGFPTDIVFDNVRKLPQYEKLLPYHFTLVRLTAPESVLAERAAKKGVSSAVLASMKAHPAEAGVPGGIPGELTFDATLPVDELANVVIATIRGRQRGFQVLADHKGILYDVTPPDFKRAA